MSLTSRKENAEAVLAQLRGVGPQTADEIRDDLRITKREVEDALYWLGSRSRVEYAEPIQSPLIYKASEH